MIKKSDKIIALPPGCTIQEQLFDKNISIRDFAYQMGMPEEYIVKLINGDVLLTKEIAKQLENILLIPVSFWLRLESIYRMKLSKINNEKNNVIV